MSRRVVVGLLSLAVGMAVIGCTSGPPRRFGRPQQNDTPQTPSAIPEPTPLPPQPEPASPPPATPAPQAAAPAPQPLAPTPQFAMPSPPTVAAAPPPAAGPITRVSVPPTEVPSPTVATTPKPATGNSPRQLYQRAVEAYATIDSYTARLRRREQASGKDMPEELILAEFRKNPFSVHFKWIGTEGQGRELIYVQGQYEDKIHTLLAATDPHILGRIMALSPESSLVRSRSRYPITEAGIGPLIAGFGRVLAQAEKTGPSMQVKSLGLVKRPEFAEMVEGVEVVFPPRADPLMPNGCRRWWFFDPQKGLPVLVVATDPAGHEVEYYCYDRLLYPVRLDELDFDPKRLKP